MRRDAIEALARGLLLIIVGAVLLALGSYVVGVGIDGIGRVVPVP